MLMSVWDYRVNGSNKECECGNKVADHTIDDGRVYTALINGDLHYVCEECVDKVFKRQDYLDYINADRGRREEFYVDYWLHNEIALRCIDISDELLNIVKNTFVHDLFVAEKNAEELHRHSELQDIDKVIREYVNEDFEHFYAWYRRTADERERP